MINKSRVAGWAQEHGLQLTEKMLEKGLITVDESDRILSEARKIFVPIMAELL